MLHDCVFREKGFYRTRDFLDRTLKEIEEKAFSCKLCGKEFISKRYLESHNVSHQPAKYKWPKCNKTYWVDKSFKKYT